MNKEHFRNPSENAFSKYTILPVNSYFQNPEVGHCHLEKFVV